MRAFKVMPKALRILAKKLTHLACNSRSKSPMPESAKNGKWPEGKSASAGWGISFREKRQMGAIGSLKEESCHALRPRGRGVR